MEYEGKKEYERINGWEEDEKNDVLVKDLVRDVIRDYRNLSKNYSVIKRDTEEKFIEWLIEKKYDLFSNRSTLYYKSKERKEILEVNFYKAWPLNNWYNACSLRKDKRVKKNRLKKLKSLLKEI